MRTTSRERRGHLPEGAAPPPSRFGTTIDHPGGGQEGQTLAQWIAAGDLRRVALAAGFRKRWGTWRTSTKQGAPGTRLEAIRGLPRLTQTHLDDVLTLLTAAAADPDWQVRQASVSCLADAVREARSARSNAQPSDDQLAATRAILLKAIRDPSDQVRAVAAEALGSFDGRATFMALVGALEDPTWEVRVAAAGTLGRRTDAADTDGIDAIAAMGNGMAVLALGMVRGSWQGRVERRACLDEHLRTLAIEATEVYLATIDRLREDPGANQSLRAGLIEVLGDPRCAPLAPQLAQRLSDRTDPALAALVHALAASGGAAVADALIEVLADRSMALDLRRAAFDEAERLGIEIPLEALDGAGPLAVDHITRTIAGCSDPVPRLLAVASRATAEPQARLTAIEALAETGDPRAVDTLAGLLLADVRLGPAVLGHDYPHDAQRWDAAFHDPQADAPQYVLEWASTPARVGVRVAAGVAIAPLLDERAPERVRLAVWLAQQRSDELCRLIERTRVAAPDDLSDLSRFVYDRLDWLDLEAAIPVARALAEAGSEPADALLRSLASTAQRMTQEQDREEEQTFMGDQTVQKHMVTVSMETTRRRGRRYLELIGVEP